MDTPILLIAFNRPHTTRRVLSAIRQARPERLYIAVDGPRTSRREDADRCAEVRRLAETIDWPCDVRTKFRSHNLGCRAAVSGAISWFYDNEEYGIVLEDDTLPEQSFFRFASEMLKRFKLDDHVSMVTGFNSISHIHQPRNSYFFSRVPEIWGWGSWRRAWQNMDIAMEGWKQRDIRLSVFRDYSVLDAPLVHQYANAFDKVAYKNLDTWDYQWFFTQIVNKGLTIYPATNLVSNIGFGDQEATHTKGELPDWMRRNKPKALSWPLTHPAVIDHDPTIDRTIAKYRLGASWMNLLKSRAKLLVTGA